MLQLLRSLGFLLVLVAVLTSPQRGFLYLLAFLTAYLLALVAVAFTSQKLMTRNPAWAIRLTRLLGLLTGSQDYRITLLAIHKDNPTEADRVWEEAEPKLARMNPSQAMALTANYAAALSFRGEYRRARDLMLRYSPGPRSRSYASFYALYWLNLAWFHYQLEDFQAMEGCLKRAEQEQITHQLVGQRLAGLQALLAHERGQKDEALRLLDLSEGQNAFSAWLLAEMGEKELSLQHLPDAEGLVDPIELTYYHLSLAILTANSDHLTRAAATTYAPGHIAYQALKTFQDPTHLPTAQEKDPESIFTTRARVLKGDSGNQGDKGDG